MRSLVERGYLLDAVVEQSSVGRLATARLIDDEVQLYVDLLFASSGIEVEVVDAADRLEIVSGLVMPVARVGHLIALKLLARDDRSRPADADDLHRLAEVATSANWSDAERAVRLIGERGFDRDRDLLRALRALDSSRPY